MIRFVLTAALVVGLTGTAHAQPVWLSLGGGYLSQSNEFEHVVTFPEHLETAVVDGPYDTSGGALVDVGASVGVAPAWAIAGGVNVFRSSSDVRLRGRIPHPLYFAQPRVVDRELESLDRNEVALRAELAWIRPLASRMRVTVSAGPMAVRASQEVAASFSVTELGYPYDEVELVPSTRADQEWGFGGTVAVAASVLATERLTIGVTARYSRATVSLHNHRVDAGGPSFIAAVSWRAR
jgi:hypothetical protein